METTRKLASIQKVEYVKPIKGADRIEQIGVLGWQLVCLKNEFKVGDLCIFVEIDSILPSRSEFEFMKDHGYRVKTIRLRKQISQGIAFPINIISGFSLSDRLALTPDALSIGDDVTERLGILKWEPQIPAMLGGRRTKTRPGFIPKTDEDRIQVIPEILHRNKGVRFYVTEKLDGSSASYWIQDEEFGVSSRNMQILPDIEKKRISAWFKALFVKPKPKKQNTFWAVAFRDGIEAKLRSVGQNICIQGELVGPGVQKNKYRLKKHKVFVYNVLDLTTGKYLNFPDMEKFCQRFGFETVPVLLTDFLLPDSVDKLVEMSKGKSELYPDQLREGIVIRSINEDIRDEHIGRLSFKVVNPNYLLLHNE